MQYTTTELITGAYYASGVVSREFETVSGQQQDDGLIWLNNIVTETNVNDGMVPYEGTYSFTLNTGQEKYFIPNLVSIDTLVFYLQNVRFAMQYEKRNTYFGTPRVENINSLPFEWYFERATGGGNLYVYFKPDRNYPMELHGSFELEPLALGQDLRSSLATANLGIASLSGTGELETGVFVVNDYDLSVIYIDPVVAGTTVPLNAVYANGTAGVGATLTNAGAMVALTLDGVTLVVGDRVLVKDQTATTQNGVYTVTVVGDGATNWVITRATDYDTPAEIFRYSLVPINQGTVAAGKVYSQTASVTLIGTSAITFTDTSTLALIMQDLVNYINTGVIENVTASYLNNEFVLYNHGYDGNITIQTNGQGGAVNNISFYRFNTAAGINEQTFLSMSYDEFYTTYLRYALADRICAEYNYVTPPNVTKQLGKYEALINKESKILDLQLRKLSTLGRREGYSWQWINLGKGYVPN